MKNKVFIKFNEFLKKILFFFSNKHIHFFHDNSHQIKTNSLLNDSSIFYEPDEKSLYVKSRAFQSPYLCARIYTHIFYILLLLLFFFSCFCLFASRARQWARGGGGRERNKGRPNRKNTQTHTHKMSVGRGEKKRPGEGGALCIYESKGRRSNKREIIAD